MTRAGGIVGLQLGGLAIVGPISMQTTCQTSALESSCHLLACLAGEFECGAQRTREDVKEKVGQSHLFFRRKADGWAPPPLQPTHKVGAKSPARYQFINFFTRFAPKS